MEPTALAVVAAVLTAGLWIAALAVLLNSFRFAKRVEKTVERLEPSPAPDEPAVDWKATGALILSSLAERLLTRKERGNPEVKMSDKRSGSAFPVLLIGAAIGAAVGILFAPKKGAETRKDLRTWLDEEADLGRELLEKGQVAGRELLERGQERLQETKEHLVEAVTSRRPGVRNGKKPSTKA